jgi:3-oxoacyl-[acyl-carrier-protein] synthase II
MEPWQRLGTYAAGLALEMAGLKGDKERLSALQLIVGCGGGERDYAVDGQILTDLPKSDNPGQLLNEKLMGELRPTLFLAQLSNLLAGNISIVHGVTGASRTFMGEEQAGVDAVRIAYERIRAGQGDAFLVGGSYNAERADALLIYAMGGFLRHKPHAPVDSRADDPGLYLGSGGAFLVLESRENAEARGATILAVLKGVDSRRSKRAAGSVRAALAESFKALPVSGVTAVISGATGIAGITDEESATLRAALPSAPVRYTGSRLGHMNEAQFPASLALAVEVLRSGRLPASVSAGEGEAGAAPDAIYVTSVGHMRGEGLALVAKAG